jgi:hypothetical protein
MHAYGVPRNLDLIHPDIVDIHEYGLKSSIGRNQKKSGDYKGYCDSHEKQVTRRRWKRMARHQAKVDIQKALMDMD